MLGLRALQRTTAAPAFRRQLIAQRRWTSGVEHKEFTGAADNAFNRERAAVKEHAAGSSGEFTQHGVTRGVIGQEGRSGVQNSGGQGRSSAEGYAVVSETGRTSSKEPTLTAFIPQTSGAKCQSINAWRLWDEHWEHKSHEPPLEEKVEYPYQNIRTKKFFWGDGDKTAFWNTDVNYHKTDEE
ncbi:Cytochrome c oxidase subunit 6A [Friedmanniomyces endolithicus]|nr:Cytochrome c oxidase subunit 6A [Friedmanniomyces endolithicus]